MEVAARDLNPGFIARMERGMPWLRSKVGMSLDGRTALSNGVSQWITGAEARLDVQHWRARSCAVLTGINTILADDAKLNVRSIEQVFPPLVRGGQEGFRQPLRVVLDSQLRMPLDAKILQGGGTLIYTANDNLTAINRLSELGVTVVVLPDARNQVDLPAVLRDLAQKGCNEVLVEAGAILNGALLTAGLLDELLLYIAPQLLGDKARGMAALGELIALNQRVSLVWQDVRQVGSDLRITVRVNK
jgi:diaminohydroxyphosphoribosylaminopyrimidine deaminase/5-amino-6-(5-phosphoribosylamino)uracil reductase